MTFELYHYKAKVVNVVDGDTIDADVDVGFRLRSTLRLRLLDVRAPEIKGPEKVKGFAVRGFVNSSLLGQEVIIRTWKTDDFGRWLALVYLEGEDFNAKINKFIQDMG